MNHVDRAGHPSEGELVRYLDRRLPDRREGRVARHLEGCHRCAGRADRLRAGGAALRKALRELDDSATPSPRVRAAALSAARHAHRRRWRRTAGRVAAGLALLLSAGLAVTPLRAWMTARWAPSAAVMARAEPVVVRSPGSELGGAVVSFEPTSGTFDVVVASPQSAGTLTLRVRDGARASAQAFGDSAPVLVLPRGVQIQNRARSSGSYTVILPASLERVRVKVGGRVIATLSPSRHALPWSASFPLAGHP